MPSVFPSDYSLGCRIEGIDLSKPLDHYDETLIIDAFGRFGVVCFPNQSLEPVQHKAFASRFGSLEVNVAAGRYTVPDHPEVMILSNEVVDGQPIGLGDAGQDWHTDMSYTNMPPTTSMLYSLEVPGAGGGTHFMDMYKVYETLPNEIKERIWGKVAVHDATYTSAGEVRKIYEEFDGNTDTDKAPGARHPLVIRHPETKKEALFLGRKSGASNIIGEPDTELFNALWDHCNKSHLSWGHEWEVGDGFSAQVL